MCRTLFLVATALGAAYLFMGCKTSPQQTQPVQQKTPIVSVQPTAAPQSKIPVEVVIEDSPEARAALLKLAQQNPTIADPQTGNQYFIMPVKPKPGIDYKIVQVKPDPNIDYKMIIAGPGSKMELEKFRNQIADAIRKQLPQQNKTK